MFRNQSASSHAFAMVPSADIPRSSFRIQAARKTTFDAGYLVPVYCEEVLPGDTFSVRMTAFARMATLIYPVMDNLYMDSFFFFVPNRLVWSNWVRFMGEQDNPADTISYMVPTVDCPASGWPIGSIGDMFGLPTVGQVVPAGGIDPSALPFRAYNLIYNQWFRDENLQDSVPINTGDAADPAADYTLLRRGKRKDYFTGCLPFVQKGTSVSIPLGATAPVSGIGITPAYASTVTSQPVYENPGVAKTYGFAAPMATPSEVFLNVTAATGGTPLIYADLSAATAATINQLRQSFQIQKLLERDARGGTRYTEIIRSHFGVISPDARLQRPEYLGGGSTPINVNPIAQTSATTVSGGDTPLATLSAFGTSVGHNHGFTQSFTEHGYVIGMVSVRADLTYQQGMRRHWSRRTRYDYYFPAFAMLGEQAVLNKEIYATGDTTDDMVFGYQERWAEYRYQPSEICGLFRSTAALTIDQWHLSQKFGTLPVLDSAFISENPPLERVLAVGADAGGQQFLMDAFFDVKAARPMPMYSVPGLVDHF